MKLTEEKTMNIPVISVSEMIDELSKLYCSAIKANHSFRNIPSVFFWGKSGVGKSDGVRELARRIEKATGKTVIVTDVRLLLFNPIDLRGIPSANADKTEAVWLKPQIFKLNDSEDVVNILFLDELSAAPQSVQAAAYQICLDRTVGEHKLPENCIVIAAGNRTTDMSVSYKMPKALANRLIHFNIKADFEGWEKWAVENKLNNYVLEYLKYDHTKLCLSPETSDLAFATPRSWKFVSDILNELNCTPDEAEVLIGATLGMDIAFEFIAFSKLHTALPPIDGILNGTYTAAPKTQDSLYKIITALEDKIADKGTTSEEINNATAYIMRYFTEDYIALFIKSALEKVDRAKLVHCTKINEWIRENHDLL